MTESDDERRQVIQRVTAAGGFAYGVVGADLHVFGDGSPVYVLENWRRPPDVDRGWLRELPSRMLNARFAVVRFTGRDDELAALREWRDKGSRLRVRWLHAPGGQGKTRLADRIAAESEKLGWKVITAIHGPGSVIPPPGSQDLRLDGAAGLLVIIDYADRWPLTHLTWLFSNALFHQVGVAARVLMLARSADGWPPVRAALANHQADTSSQSLAPLSDDGGKRDEMFTAARDSFARYYDVTDANSVQAPISHEHADECLTLAVHMSALVAVDAYATGRHVPKTMAGLTIYLLDREQLHWFRLYGDSRGLPAAERTFGTPAAVMNRLVFSAALTGPCTPPTGVAIVKTLSLEQDPQRLLADHATCYPPSYPGRGTVLEPLYPDRLAEDFLALTIPGHHADYPAQRWAAPAATMLADRHGDLEYAAVPGSRAITFLATAAQRWPHLGDNCLYPLLYKDPRLAIDAGSAALAAIAAIDTIDIEILDSIESVLPDQRHVDLDPGIAVLAERLARHRLSRTVDDAHRAVIYAQLAIRLSNAGLHEQALSVSEEAVLTYRRLAESNPAEVEPVLAESLVNLGLDLGRMGRREEALVAVEEGVKILRKLTVSDPAEFTEDLAGALSNLSSRLSVLGRRDEAFAASAEAVRILRELALDDPAAHEEALAGGLSNLGADAWDLGHREEALSLAEEAVQIGRRIAETNPTAYEPDLADSMSNLAVWLTGLGRQEEAISAGEETVRLYRRLAKANPAAFEPDLAGAVANLAAVLAGSGLHGQGLPLSMEAVEIYRRLAKANPAAFEADLAGSMGNLAIRLTMLGQPESGLQAAEEAVQIYRRLHHAEPAAFEPDLAEAVSNLANFMGVLGRRGDALPLVEEATSIYRRLAEAAPEAFEPRLADSLCALALWQGIDHRKEAAFAASREALHIYRRLVETIPEAFEPGLARTLSTSAIIRAQMHLDLKTAFIYAKEAVTIFVEYAVRAPEKYLDMLTGALIAAAEALNGLGFIDEASGISNRVDSGQAAEAAQAVLEISI